MKKDTDGEPIICYDLYDRTGAPIDFIDCNHCGFRNIINCPYPAPKKRLSSVKCMKCAKRLNCPSCGRELREGLISERDAILFCSNNECGFWFNIW